MKIVIKTLGCKANRYESEKIMEKFKGKFVVADASQAERLDWADAIIVNTCTVTHNADRKSRQAVSFLKTLYPRAKVIIFGCGANTDENGYKKLKNVDYIVKKPEELNKLLEKISKSIKNKRKNNNYKIISRTRALIKIQDGCNNFCSYCIVPFARGREKSRSSAEIIKEIKNRVNNGYKEIVITGINIGEWKENGKDLADLIEMILDKTKVERLRLSSIEPQNFSEKFLRLFKNPRFCPHLHISLQSGSDEILKKMRRHYDTSLFTKMVNNLRKTVPHFGITTDIIVGFPGETEKMFNETLKYVKKIGFGKIHIFPYSKRKGTIAAEMPEQIPAEIKKKRCKKLAEVEKKLRLEFYKKNIGRNENVLVEIPDCKNSINGFTSNYIQTRIRIKNQRDFVNTIQKITLKKISPSGEIEAKLKT